MNAARFLSAALPALAAIAAAPAAAQFIQARPGLGVPAAPVFPTAGTTAMPPVGDAASPNPPPPTIQAIRWSPAVSISETYSDNPGLTAATSDRDGWITDFSPSLRMDLATARVQGYVDYRMHQLLYSGVEGLDRRENFLDASTRFKVVEEFLFLDARANVTQANVSPFGVASTPGQAGAASNRTETRSAQLSPFVRGQVGDLAVYQVKLNATALRPRTELIPPTNAVEWVAQVANPSGGTVFGWVADAASIEVRNDLFGTRDNRRLRAGLVYSSPFDVRATILALHESTDFAGGERRSDTTGGFALDWAPSPRTRASGIVQRRFFGTGHELLFTHKSPRTAWTITSTREAVALGSQSGIGALASLRNVMEAAMANTVLDPAERGRAATRRFEAAGIADSSPLSSESLVTRPFLYQGQSASFAAIGLRNTITVTATRREERSLEPGTAATLDGDVRQRGIAADFSTRLGPYTSATFALARIDSRALDSARETRQEQYSFSLVTRLGPRTTASAGVRRLRFDSNVAGEAFHENAVYCAFTYRM